jgi:hypothetical protein
MAEIIPMPEVKSRRISDRDWKNIEDYIKKELNKRKTDSFRKQHERIWKEVDRQVYMKSPKKLRLDPSQKVDWRSAIELGELSKASEIITADVMRLMFPDSRSCFECHCELPSRIDPHTGKNAAPDQKQQDFIDHALRALMAQQHMDFGFKSRVSLSIKEALHHGSFVSEAVFEKALMVHDDAGISTIGAPTWVPHSMWNCYPDPSPSIMGTNMFYTGSMIIVEYKPRHKFEDEVNSGMPGWMPQNLKRVSKRTNTNKDVQTEDLEIIKYFGDCVIKRDDGDIYLPNSKIILANDVLVFYAPNELPFPSIIFNGYEKLDVRDPYFVSPLIKLSPMHKVATVLLNKFLDSCALHTEPPILYDGNDPTFVKNGGPTMAPGWKGPTKSLANYKVLEIGDPAAVLQGYEVIISQIKQGTTADSGTGLASADRTATEIRREASRSEVRVVDFVEKMDFSFKTFLYMQHELNLKYMDTYTFYNQEMDSPDFMRMSREDLPQNVRFDVVGSKGILGEEERSQKMMIVTSMAAQNDLFRPLLNAPALLTAAYQDAGVKNPERYVNAPNDDLEQVKQQIAAQFQQMIDELKSENFDLQQKLAISQSVNQAKIQEANIRGSTNADVAKYKAHVQAQLDSFKVGMDMMSEKEQKENPELLALISSVEKLIEIENNDTTDEQMKEIGKKIDELSSGLSALEKEVKRPKKKKPIRNKDGVITEIIEE